MISENHCTIQDYENELRVMKSGREILNNVEISQRIER